ncbi:GSCOCG00005519001-RA-CDS [Cotesia congregata]|nr:GSCOCG00005519001-RA-CDS [Cotesia congregata]
MNFLGYESGGSSVNGHRIDNNYNQDHPFNNANAPPPEHHDSGYNQKPGNSDLGYPSYPSTNNGGHYSPPNSGAPGSNLGYPPYPNQNRMPQPGYYPQNNNGYPNYQQPGLNNQYPSHQYNTHNYNDRKYLRAPRRPGVGGRGNGDRGRPYVAPQPIPPTPPPRSSSRGYGNRYPGNGGYGRSSNSIGTPDSVWNRDYDSTNRGGGSGRRGQRPSTYNGGKNNHNTHIATDSNGNRVWTMFSHGTKIIYHYFTKKQGITRFENIFTAHEQSKDVLYPQNSASAPEPGHSNNSPVPSAPVSLPNQPSKPSGYPTGSVYPPNPSGGASYPSYPSSAPSYPSSGSSYPSYPSPGFSYPSYPSSVGSSYPNYPSSGSGYPADTTRKQNMGTVNAGYPSTGQQAQYPAGGSYYPQGGYPQSNYPQSGYPQNSYQGQYPQNPYPGQYPQNPYQGQYPQQPQKPKKPSFTDQLTNFAKNIATRVLTQAVIDKVSG